MYQKLRINAVNHFYLHKINKYLIQLLFFIDEYYLIMWVSISSIIFNQWRLSGIMLGKDNIFSVNTTFHFPTFEDKGRLHVYRDKIKIDHCRDNPFQARLSEIAMDRDRTWFCYNWLGLFICWNGPNYPVPSSPLHTPGSWAHWPNGME